ncbi:hypothetical protein Tco_0298273, partial [Tanacetum coccineum]
VPILRTSKYGESNAYALEDLTLSAGNHVKEVLPKLNLPDHRYKRWYCSLILAELDSSPHTHPPTTKTCYKHQDSKNQESLRIKDKDSRKL